MEEELIVSEGPVYIKFYILGQVGTLRLISLEMVSAEIRVGGDIYWRENTFSQIGRWHRDDGPAIELNNGSTFCFLHGLTHNANGPAINWGSNPPTPFHPDKKEFWIFDKKYTEKEYWKKVKNLKTIERGLNARRNHFSRGSSIY